MPGPIVFETVGQIREFLVAFEKTVKDETLGENAKLILANTPIGDILLKKLLDFYIQKEKEVASSATKLGHQQMVREEKDSSSTSASRESDRNSSSQNNSSSNSRSGSSSRSNFVPFVSSFHSREVEKEARRRERIKREGGNRGGGERRTGPIPTQPIPTLSDADAQHEVAIP